ncbi:MAG: hypothetical protein H6811_12325 [Phycisphaeraceae bacterium]|nr:hypothetical protein [Phycisphaeraceae bacterium]
MIRRQRGTEPLELARERSWRVARALLYGVDRTVREDGTLSTTQPTDLGYNIPAVRDALRTAQYGRCAYCATRTVEASYDHLEHYRPRAHYWWLTWTWENLWLACNVCQGKSNSFPCEPGTEPLAAPTRAAVDGAFALSTERPLLLDPACDLPQHHLAFAEVEGTNGGWFWKGTTGRGQETIAALHLKRVIRHTEYDDLLQHIRRWLEPATQRVASALAEGDAERARAAWEQCGDAFLWSDPATSSEAPFRVPSWWYMRAFYERSELAAHAMVMWCFPDHAGDLPPDPRPLLDDELPDALSPEARLHVNYIRGAGVAPKEHMEAAIKAVCACGSWSVDALAELLGRAKGTIQKAYVRPLVRDGHLRHDGEGYVSVGGANTEPIDGTEDGQDERGEGE